jgi:adenine-specific DNA glycosylase
MHPLDRVERLRRCAELRLAGAPWKSYPGIGRPGAERIELFSGERAVFALDSNAARVLFRLGYGERRSSYSTMYREIQAAAQCELPSGFDGTESRFCTRNQPACAVCPVRKKCAAGRGLRSVEDPFAKP